MPDKHMNHETVHRRLRFAAHIIASLAILSAASVQATANAVRGGIPNPTPQCHVRAEDEIWLISTRHLAVSASCCPNTPQLKYCRYRTCDGWQKASKDDFLAGDDPTVITTIYVHGNRMPMPYVYDRGFQTYCEAKCGLTPEQRIRHVIWSWPSTQIAGPIGDFKIKASWTPLQSYYMASWLAKIHPEVRVSLMGYSYGGRVVLGALHLLAGGTLEGRCLADTAFLHEDVPRCRVAVWAAALQSDWLLPGRTNGSAMQVIDRMLVLYNPRDPVLRNYWRLTRNRNHTALGRCGVSCQYRLGEAAQRIDQINANSMVGGKHRWEPYVDSIRLMNSVRQNVQWHLIDGPPDESPNCLPQRPMAATSQDGDLG